MGFEEKIDNRQGYGFYCRLWIDNRQLEFTADSGLKTRQFTKRFWLRRGVLKDVMCLLSKIHQ